MGDFFNKINEIFLTDNRWTYLTKGLINSLIITFFAAILGLIIGFIIAVIRSTHDKTGKMKFLNIICRIYLTIIRGTPSVVQLMIMYFIIFATLNSKYKIYIAIISFGINSGAYVAEIVRSGIMSIDNGQFEAGASLGLSYSKTMMLIIMPQAVKTVLPALANEVIVLLKETSISGYIGIQDLTKGGDVIRSVTYNAYMPLIAVALIYLIIVMILTYLVSILERRLAKNEKR